MAASQDGRWFVALARLFARENEQVRREQILSLQGILTGTLEPESAFADLVYVLETAAEMELASEEEILPVYGKLMPLRKRAVSDALEELQAVRAELHERLSPLLRTAEPVPETHVP